MPRSAVRNRLAAAATAITVVAGGLAASVPVSAAPNHATLPADVPTAATPDVMDNMVSTIHDAGSKVIAGGNFTRVQNRDSDVDIDRRSVFAFSKATGAVDTAFAPVLDDEVTAIIAGPTAGTVYIAGRFNTVNGVNRRKLALVNVADGSLVTGFAPPAFNGLVTDIVLTGGRLLVGGTYTSAGANPRGGLASLDPMTGRIDTYLTTNLTGNHNWNGTGAKAPVGVENLALSPDGSKLVVIGNFKNADGVLHDQVVMLNLGATVSIADWNTSRYTPRCAYRAFDSYVRDVAFSPDGSYFVIVTTGAYSAGTLCDTAARWEADVTGQALQPTWINYTGGDTLLSVGISERAVFVGGHMRWVNNSFSADTAGAGSVPRPSLAALDPASGMPLRWNPGRHPRGYGVTDIHLTPEGLWIGHDQSFVGAFEYRRERIAFFPLNGGPATHSTQTATLPGPVYSLGVAGTGGGGGEPLPSTVLFRVNAGGPAVAPTDGGPGWTADDVATNQYRTSGSVKLANTAVTTVDATVPAGTPINVFQSMRYDPADGNPMQWNFPAAAGRRLEVRLYFADYCTCTRLPGQRVFDVQLDGATVLDDFDVSAATGTRRGTMRSFKITSDGNVDLDFVNNVESPIINAIEILGENEAPTTPGNGIVKRSYDGATTVGAAEPVPPSDATAWSTAKGAFWVGGTVFYGMNGSLQRRTFNGTTFGAASTVNPYRDVLWDTVETGSGVTGQTYAGSPSSFYSEINTVSGMFYANGRLYYAIANQTGLFWRWFSPDSGAVGADKFTVGGASGFASAGAVFVSGGFLYMTNRTTGTLSRMGWTGSAPSGAATVVSGPLVNGVDWRAAATFVGP